MLKNFAHLYHSDLNQCELSTKVLIALISSHYIEQLISSTICREIVEAFPFILAQAQTFPSLISVFQSLLSVSTLLDLVNQGADFIKQLNPSNFIVEMLTTIRITDFEVIYPLYLIYDEALPARC